MWVTRWNEIESRIDTLHSSADIYFNAIQTTGEDYFGVSGRHVIPEAREIRELIVSFRRTYSDVLSPGAIGAFDRFIRDSRDTFQGASGINGVAGVAVSLGAIRAGLAYHLKGVDTYGNSITERSFEHLRRSIVVDDGIRTRWISAFKEGEVQCEKLGSVHMLLHGIWAFKVDAKGERTDLVFGDPLSLGAAERTAPSAIVLTEWKVARTSEDAVQQLGTARKQAEHYSTGSLSDLELLNTRYLIVVTERRVEMPADIMLANVRYRHINIAVNPEPPSKGSKR